MIAKEKPARAHPPRALPAAAPARMLAAVRTKLSQRAQRSGSLPAARETRRRLLFINLGVVSAIVVVMAVAVFAIQARAISGQVDATLTSWAEHHSSTDHLGPDATPAQGPAADPDEADTRGRDDIYEPSSPNVFSVVLDTRGSPVFDPAGVQALGLPDTAAARRALAGGTTGTFETVRRGSHEYRLFTEPVYTNGRLAGVMQAGMSLDSAERQMRDLLLTLALVGLAVLALTAAASVFLADRALIPMRLAFDRQRQFSAGASHELRTPLAIARSQADLVVRRLRRAADSPQGLTPAGAAALDGDMGELVAELDYMTRLVRDLLTLARTDTETISLAHDLLDLREVAREAVAKVRPAAEARGLTLVEDDAAGDATAAADVPVPVLVAGDADRLRQLALILLDNAIRYTPAGGTITVRVTARRRQRLGVGHRDEALLVVRDTGMGIAPADLGRIFEPFYRADQAKRRAAASASAEPEEGSAGLGLALARWITAAHRGETSVESAPGAGSAFTVALPMAE